MSRIHISIYRYIYRFVELHLEGAHFYHDQILREDATTMKIGFRDHCLCTVSPNVSRVARWCNYAHFLFCRKPHKLFINLYKFFSNSFFAKILNFVLSLFYNRKAWRLQFIDSYDGLSLWYRDRDEYIAVSCNNESRNAFYHTMLRGACPHTCQVISRAPGKTIDRNACHGDILQVHLENIACWRI